jgi:UDP-N-acetylmuramate--alanine ligase
MQINLENITHTYFLGIGGIGMSAIARWFNTNGIKVAGYDKTPTPLTQALINEGIEVHYTDSVHSIPAPFLANKQKTLVVLTPAIPAGHQELNYLQNEGFTIKKRAEVLGIISDSLFTLAVAGTHGKTTTSTILAHILKYSDANMSAFLGGISANYQSNLLLNIKKEGTQIVVVEADEYDRSFLRLSPDVAVITAIEPDHLDIYGDENAVKDSFTAFAHKVRNGGKLFVQQRFIHQLPADIQLTSYGIDEGDIQANRVTIREGVFYFDISQHGKLLIENIALSVPGFHNVENTVAACAVALHIGIEPQKIKEAIATFKGVQRRFEYVFKGDKYVYIDDYAHHPTEIEAFIKGVKTLYPDKKLTVVFQPHLFTRTRDFCDGFAASLSLADHVYLMQIYPARELPIEGITSKIIYDKITTKKTLLQDERQLLNIIRNIETDVLATIGAGDIDRFPSVFGKILKARELKEDIFLHLEKNISVALQTIRHCNEELDNVYTQYQYLRDIEALTKVVGTQMDWNSKKEKIKGLSAQCDKELLSLSEHTKTAAANIDKCKTMIEEIKQLLTL